MSKYNLKISTLKQILAEILPSNNSNPFGLSAPEADIFRKIINTLIQCCVQIEKLKTLKEGTTSVGSAEEHVLIHIDLLRRSVAKGDDKTEDEINNLVEEALIQSAVDRFIDVFKSLPKDKIKSSTAELLSGVCLDARLESFFKYTNEFTKTPTLENLISRTLLHIKDHPKKDNYYFIVANILSMHWNTTFTHKASEAKVEEKKIEEKKAEIKNLNLNDSHFGLLREYIEKDLVLAQDCDSTLSEMLEIFQSMPEGFSVTFCDFIRKLHLDILPDFIEHVNAGNANSALDFAIKLQNPLLIKKCVALGAHLDRPNRELKKPIEVAADIEAWEVIETIVSNYPEDKEDKRNYGYALHAAARANNKSLVLKLLKQKVSPFFHPNDGLTAFHWAIKNNAIQNESEPSLAHTLIYNFPGLLDFPALTTSAPKVLTPTALMVASESHTTSCATLLYLMESYQNIFGSRALESYINRQDKDNETALYKAAKAGNVEKIHLLLRNKANPAITCGVRRPIDIALIHGNFAAAFVFLSTDPVPRREQLVTLNSSRFPINGNQNSLLHLAAHFDNGRELFDELKKNRIDPEFSVTLPIAPPPPGGTTPLALAAKNGSWKFLDYALKAAAESKFDFSLPVNDNILNYVIIHAAKLSQWKIVEAAWNICKSYPNLRTTAFSGWNLSTFVPLHFAVRDNRIDIAKEILNSGAHINHHAHTMNQNVQVCEKTSLALAAESKDVTMETFNWLLAQPNIDLHCKESKNQTPLMMAATSGFVEKVAALYAKGKSKYQTTPEGKTEVSTAIEKAVAKGHVSVVMELISHGGDDLHRTFAEGDTLLHWAVKQRLSEFASILLALGINKNIKNTAGASALDIASEKEYWDIVQTILNSTANLREAKPENPKEYDLTMLKALNATPPRWEIVYALIEKNLGLDVISPETGYGLVHKFVLHNQLELLFSLLPVFDVNSQSKAEPKPTPLMVATDKIVNIDTFKKLLTSGAKVNMQDSKGLTALMHLASTKLYTDNEKKYEIEKEKTQAKFQALLEMPGLLIDSASNTGDTALNFAISSDNFFLVEMLLPKYSSWHCIDFNYIDSSGESSKNSSANTLLHMLIRHPNPITFEILQKYIFPLSAETQSILNAKNSKGETPFFLAAQSGNRDKIEFLLRQPEINISLANNTNITPWQAAMDNLHEEEAELIAKIFAEQVENAFLKDVRKPIGLKALDLEQALSQCALSLKNIIPHNLEAVSKDPSKKRLYHNLLEDIRWEQANELVVLIKKLLTHANNYLTLPITIKFLSIDILLEIHKAFIILSDWAIPLGKGELLRNLPYESLSKLIMSPKIQKKQMAFDARDLETILFNLEFYSIYNFKIQFQHALTCYLGFYSHSSPINLPAELANKLEGILENAIKNRHWDFVKTLCLSNLVKPKAGLFDFFILHPESKEEGSITLKEERVPALMAFLQKIQPEMWPSEIKAAENESILHLLVRCNNPEWLRRLVSSFEPEDILVSSPTTLSPLQIATEIGNPEILNILLNTLEIFEKDRGQILVDAFCMKEWSIVMALLTLGVEASFDNVSIQDNKDNDALAFVTLSQLGKFGRSDLIKKLIPHLHSKADFWNILDRQTGEDDRSLILQIKEYVMNWVINNDKMDDLIFLFTRIPLEWLEVLIEDVYAGNKPDVELVTTNTDIRKVIILQFAIFHLFLQKPLEPRSAHLLKLELQILPISDFLERILSYAPADLKNTLAILQQVFMKEKIAQENIPVEKKEDSLPSIPNHFMENGCWHLALKAVDLIYFGNLDEAWFLKKEIQRLAMEHLLADRPKSFCDKNKPLDQQINDCEVEKKRLNEAAKQLIFTLPFKAERAFFAGGMTQTEAFFKNELMTIDLKLQQLLILRDATPVATSNRL